MIKQVGFLFLLIFPVYAFNSNQLAMLQIAKQEGTIEKEGGGWWTSIVKDESQLKEVFEYYDRMMK